MPAPRSATDGKKLGPGDIVWAKLRGFPYWPAKIQNPTKFAHYKPFTRPGGFPVYFYGSHDYQWVAKHDIIDFKTYFDDHKAGASGTQFKQALHEAQNAATVVEHPFKYNPDEDSFDDSSSMLDDEEAEPETSDHEASTSSAPTPTAKKTPSKPKVSTAAIERPAKKAPATFAEHVASESHTKPVAPPVPTSTKRVRREQIMPSETSSKRPAKLLRGDDDEHESEGAPEPQRRKASPNRAPKTKATSTAAPARRSSSPPLSTASPASETPGMLDYDKIYRYRVKMQTICLNDPIKYDALDVVSELLDKLLMSRVTLEDLDRSKIAIAVRKISKLGLTTDATHRVSTKAQTLLARWSETLREDPSAGLLSPAKSAPSTSPPASSGDASPRLERRDYGGKTIPSACVSISSEQGLASSEASASPEHQLADSPDSTSSARPGLALPPASLVSS